MNNGCTDLRGATLSILGQEVHRITVHSSVQLVPGKITVEIVALLGQIQIPIERAAMNVEGQRPVSRETILIILSAKES